MFTRHALARVVAAAWFAAAATAFTASAVHAAEPTTLKWAYNLPTRWDPVTSVTGYDIHLLSLTYSGLTRLNEQGEAKPALAESWAYNDAGTEVVFKLRPGLKFSDDTPLDAEAVRAHLQRARTQKNSSAKEVLESVADVVAVDPLTVRIVLNRPDYQLPLILAGRPGLITSATVAARDPASLDKKPVGAGPFKLTEVVTESHAYFVKDPNYWDAANIHIDKFELYVALDKTSIIPAIRSGVYDFAEINANQVDEAKRAGLVVEAKPSQEARAVFVNINEKPFDDARVVEAVRYGTNRQEYIDKITFGYAKATNQPFPPTDPTFSTDVNDLWPYDPDRARKLLADAGYPPGTLSVTIKGSAGTVLEILQKQLKAIGINATIQALPAGQSITEIIVRKQAQIAANIGTQGRESPVLGLLSAYGVTGNINLSAPFASDAFLKAIDQVRKTPIDSKDYLPALHLAVKEAVVSNPTNWLYSSPRIIAHSPRVTDVPSVPITFRWEGAKVKQP
ncbi:ABC transporter substrate-binding protein [Achromobacter insolitus]|uniref:HTH-type transcriptional regulator SgrR n=1 Tax=Achromobacter insolitus TaxID=217204 RepID=A0A6S7EVM0_9BURK|nr:ABC transporter substrate-binding protein [Achromobacter insolitus]CAB3929375.1 HTH-type transcriptional regulator SgrR [Achromobacter insolitus]CAB3944867.1 HTH-type transcriptional regulator SgrR [Achromobacter insolitus]